MNRKVVFCIAVLTIAVLACSGQTFSTDPVVGSGKVISEERNVGGFDSVDLQGSADVKITFGTTESVTVKADDNIVPLIETIISNGKLVIRNRSNTSITTSNLIQVNIVAKSLQEITLSGSGNINVSDRVGQDLAVALPGSGNINVGGSADNLTIRLPGSGNIFCDGLKADSATVSIDGSGSITVYASESLDASIRGSGTIRYDGDPEQVTTNVSGSGSITP